MEQQLIAQQSGIELALKKGSTSKLVRENQEMMRSWCRNQRIMVQKSTALEQARLNSGVTRMMSSLYEHGEH